ncbi:nuclear transport factor 2 family protein [Streptomyces sp. ODS28]|uniref:nuclear transport factor 2 family protein n=1 Tax=Streptomyces sp. ODS28 TaxID=3136688 RepID=UPI0031E8484C
MAALTTSANGLPAWFARALDSLSEGDVDGWVQVYAPDAVHEFPFAAEGEVRRLEGREAIAAYLARLPEHIRFGYFSDIRVREAGDELIVEAQGHHHRLPEDVPFDLDYVWFVTVRDGRVAHLRDYMGPPRPAAA